MNSLKLPALLAAATLAASASVNAAVYFKDVTTTDINNPANWSTTSGASTPDPVTFTAADELRFNEYFAPTNGTNYTANLSADLTVGAIRLDSGNGNGGAATGNIVISGSNTLTLMGAGDPNYATSGIVMNSGTGGTLTINSNLALGASQTWTLSRALTVNGGLNLGDKTLTISTFGVNSTTTINGVVSGAGANLIKNQLGTLVLTGNNTYSGTTTVSTGTLSLTGSGTINGGAINVSGGILTLAGSAKLNATSGGAININSGTLNTYSVNALGASASTLNLGAGETQGALNYTGAGETTDRVINFAGTTGGATLNANGTGLLHFTANSTTTGAGGKGVFFDGTGSGRFDGSIINNGGVLNITKNGTGTWTLGGNINTAAGAVTVNAGTLNLSGVSTYTGATNVTAGRLNLTGSLASNITVTGGSISGTGSTTGSLTLNGGSIALTGGVATTGLTANGVNFVAATALNFLTTPVVGNYDVITYGAGGVTNYANLTTAGYRGTLTNDALNQKIVFAAGGAGARTWNTTSGTWGIGTGANFAEGDQKFYAGDTVFFNEPTSASLITLSGRLTPASVTVNNTVNKITFTGTAGTADITGATTLTKNGAGILAITTAQTYSGGTTLSAGTLQAGDNAAFGTGVLTLNGGRLSSDSTTARTLANAVTLGGDITTGDSINTGALTLGGTVNLGNAARTITTDSALTLSGVISNGGLTKAGTGTLTLSNAGNSFAGNVTINGGTLTAIGASANTNTALGLSSASRSITVNNGATLFISGNNVLGNSTQTLGNMAKIVVNSGSTLTTNAYNVIGNIDLNGGTLTATAGSGTTYQTYEFNGSTITVGGTSASTISSSATSNGGMHIAGGKTLTLDVGITGAGTDLTISAALLNGSGDRGGNGSLVKTGAGTAALTGTNTFTGNVTVNAGVLDLTAGKLFSSGYNNTSIVTVNTGGTLKLNSFTYNTDASLGQLADYGARRVINGGTIEVTAATESSGNNFNVGANGGTFRYKPADSSNTLTLTGNGNSNIAVAGALTFDTVGNITVGETIEGAGSIIKTGANRLSLSAANTYTGGTTVAAGRLVTGNTAALGTGSVAVASGASLQVGNGTANSVTLSSGANLVVAAGGTLALGGSNALITLTGAGGFTLTGATLDLGQHFDTFTGGTYQLITGGTGVKTAGATITGYDTGAFSSVTLDNSGLLTFTAIPEPSTYGLLGAGALGAVAMIRRRRKTKVAA